jgi:DNA repair ATPase RecN
MSRHFVTLRFIPGEYRDFDAKDGVFECSVDVHSVIAQLEDCGHVPSMETLTDAEFDRDEAIKETEELVVELSAAEDRIERLLNMIDDLESELREARDEIQEMLDGP